jgi:hypothetical protein
MSFEYTQNRVIGGETVILISAHSLEPERQSGIKPGIPNSLILTGVAASVLVSILESGFHAADCFGCGIRIVRGTLAD